MIQAKCTKKYRDNQGRIYGYELIDLNGNKQEIKAEKLKSEIYKKHINVVNLTMTSDRRLIDKKEENLQKEEINKKPVTATSSMKRLINKVKAYEQKFCSDIGSGQIRTVKSQLFENEALTYRDIIDNIYKDFYMVVDITVNNKDKLIRIALVSESRNDNTEQDKVLASTLVLLWEYNSIICKDAIQDIENKFNRMYINTSAIIREDKQRIAREQEIKECFKHNFSIDMLNREQLLNAFEQAMNNGEILKKETYTEWDLQKFAASKGMVDKHNEVIVTMHKLAEVASILIRFLELYKYNNKSVRLHNTDGKLADRPIKITYKVENIELTKFKSLKELQSSGEPLYIPIIDTGLDDVPYLMLGPAIDNNGNYIVDKCRIYFSDSNALDVYNKIINENDLYRLTDKMNKDYELVGTYDEVRVMLRYMYAR